MLRLSLEKGLEQNTHMHTLLLPLLPIVSDIQIKTRNNKHRKIVGFFTLNTYMNFLSLEKSLASLRFTTC